MNGHLFPMAVVLMSTFFRHFFDVLRESRFIFSKEIYHLYHFHHFSICQYIKIQNSWPLTIEWFWCPYFVYNFVYNLTIWWVVINKEVIYHHPFINHNSSRERIMHKIIHKIVALEFSLTILLAETNTITLWIFFSQCYEKSTN